MQVLRGLRKHIKAGGIFKRDDKRTPLMDTLQTESERLDQYIESLLNMTKLGNETIKLNKEWVGVDELIGAAVRRLKRYRPAQVIHIYFCLKRSVIYLLMLPFLSRQFSIF